ncbi:MAG: helix-turn-helix domain-containing protein [Myxococcota bacterium]
MSVRTAILDAAERRFKSRGYHGFSFRDVARDVGIKTSSIHYYYPAKGDLAAEVLRRYTTRALKLLGAPDDDRHLIEKLELAERAFGALASEGDGCVSSFFANEIEEIPDAAAAATRDFFVALLDWFDAAFASAGYSESRSHAVTRLSLLQGALLLSRVLAEPPVFALALDGHRNKPEPKPRETV